MKELRQAQGERDALKRRTETLAAENRDVGAKWQGAVARNKELEVGGLILGVGWLVGLVS